MKIGVPKEIKPQENRIGLTPDSVKTLVSEGHEVLVENNGGFEAGFENDQYLKAGAKITDAVSDIYNDKLIPKVNKLDTFQNVIIEISSKRMGAVCVVENNKILGIITDGDLRRYLQKNHDISNTVAEKLMTRNPKTIDKNELAFSAFNEMKKYNITQLLVLSNNEYSGIIHLHDILKEEII